VTEAKQPAAAALAELFVDRSPTGKPSYEPMHAFATDADGALELDLAAGRYRLAIQVDGHAPAIVMPIDVPALGVADLGTIEVRRGADVTGTVRFAAPPERLIVRLDRPEDDYGSLFATVDPATGAFTFANVLPGAWRVVVSDGRTTYAPIALDVPEGGLANLALEPQPK
jgi:hypothetical protein